MKKLLFVLTIFISLYSCDKDEPVQEPESETNYVDENNFSKLNKGVISINPNENITSITTNSITINTNTPNILNLKKGQIIVSGQTNQTQSKGKYKKNTRKKGFLRKVTDVFVNGSEVIIQTVQAKLEDAFEELKIETKPLIDYENFNSFETENTKLTLNLNDKTFNLEVILADEDQNYETDNDQVVYKSDFRIIENNSEFVLSFGPLIEDRFSISNSMEIELINEINFKKEMPFEKEITVAEIPLYSVFPKDFSASINLEIKVGINGNISSSFVVKNTTNIKTTNYIEHVDGNWKYLPENGNNAVIVNSNSEVFGNVNLTTNVFTSTGFEIELFDNENLKAGIYLQPYIRFLANYNSTLNNPFHWEFGYGGILNAEAKLKTDISFINLDYNQIIWESSYIKLYESLYIPSILTNNITDVTQTSAKSGGNITSDGGTSITERGIVWSTNANPTTNDNNIIDSQNTTGTFSSVIESLTPNTTYYIRAYATNSEGTSYGEQKEFTTLVENQKPTVSTNNITDITQTSAKSGGNITSDGGTSIIKRGIVWSTNANPTTNDNNISDSQNTTGTFFSVIESLTPNTTYYIRAYATNSEGTSYGEQKEFTTLVENQKPSVSTNNIIDITQTSAKSGGNIESDGGTSITERGIVWNTITNPTTNDSKIIDPKNTMGTFSSTIENLAPNTTYYVKAYATNSQGTAYGEEKEFTTDSNTQTEPVHSPTPLNGAINVELNGTFSFTIGNNTPSNAIFKIYLDTNSNPTIEHSLGGTSRNYSNLEPNTTYYWKVETLDNNNSGAVLATSETWSFTTTNESTQLDSGDLYITSLNEENDSFSFVILEEITNKTIIYFTDKGWDNNINQWKNPTGEGIIKWEYNGFLSSGTEITINQDNLTSSHGNIEQNGIFNISAQGDSILAYVGNYNSPSKFLYGVNSNDNWTTESYLPNNLTLNRDAMTLINSSPNNWSISCPQTTNNTKQYYQSYFIETSNWLSSQTPFSPPNCTININ